MVRRDFRTPPSLPELTQTRCITIPNSQPWLGLVNAALLMLTEAWRYEQVEETDLTPEATAAAAYAMYVQYLGECPMACCPMRYNPYTGRLQQSDDGGLTWFDVDDGPWTESLYPPFGAMPPVRPESGTEAKLCAAASNAATVYANLYEQTGNYLLNYVAATDWEYAGGLGAMIQGFLMVIGAAAAQPFVAISTLLGVVGVRQQYLDYPLDSQDIEDLTCIMLEHGFVQPSGAVTFDFQAVWDAIDLDSPKNGLVRFLLTMTGPDALNFAGGVDIVASPDCTACNPPDEWCYLFDFMGGDDGDFAPVQMYNANGSAHCGTATGETYYPTLGWRIGASRGNTIGRTFAQTTITRIVVQKSGNTGGSAVNLFNNTGGTPYSRQDSDNLVALEFGSGAGTVDSGPISFEADEIALVTCTASGSIFWEKMWLYGTGTNPFGTDNCEE